jgi:signal transduction histidine kinase
MLRSLHARLLLAFVLVVAVAVGIAEVIAERAATSEFGSYRRSTDTAYVESLAQELGEYYAATGSWEGVQSVFAALPVVPGRLELLDASGAVVAQSTPGYGPGGSGGEGGPSGTGGNTPQGAGGGGSGGGMGQMEGQQGRGSGAGQQSAAGGEESGTGDAVAGTAAQSVPVVSAGQQVATLIMLSGQGSTAAGGQVSDRFIDRVRTALLVGGIAALLAALLLAALVVGSVTRPLRRLRDAARRLASGDFSHRVEITAPAEAAELGTSFNHMAEALERDKEARHRLLADIAHELRTPLSVIQGTAQAFLDGVIPPDQEHAAVIRDQAVQLSKLITDLRDVSMAEAGELRLEAVPSDLGELARQAATAAQHRAEEQGIELEVAVSTSVPLCLIDSARTLQIIGNLLDNALRHTPRGGRVTLRVGEREGGVIAVEIEDTGEGIPPEHLPHVFERFYRVDASRARSGGTGLGLAIVSQLARAQGGSVSVESEPGRGSTFRVTFPVVSAGSDVRRGAAPGGPATTPGR